MENRCSPTGQVTGRVFSSDYLLWAKTRSRARFNLATSGVPGYPLAKLGVSIEDLEINGPGGYGYTPLREAISQEYGVPVPNIVAAGGASGANEYAFLLMLGPGDHALIETPVYDILPNLALFTGASVSYFERRPENGWAPDPAEIERLITPATKLIILTNLHNPSCASLTTPQIQEISAIAARHGAYILVDEAYLDSVWEPERQPTAFHAGTNVIVTSSLTKVYGFSGLRCGWIFAPADIAERLWRLIDLFDNIPAHPAELLSVKAFGKLADVRESARALIERNRSTYRAFAEARGFEVPRYGTVAFPKVTEKSADGICERLREELETTVVPGRFFGSPDRIRISLVAPSGMLEEGLARLAAVVT